MEPQLDENGNPIPDPGQAYDQAAQAGPGPAATAAWGQYVGTGQTSSPARVYPPVQPGGPEAVQHTQIRGPHDVPMPDMAEQVIQLAQKMHVPLAQAQQAVDAQEKYQAQRGYQADVDLGIAHGFSPEVAQKMALPKWAPMLMSSGKGAYGMPEKPNIPQSRNVGGVLYERNQATGAWDRETPDKVSAPKATLAVNNIHKALIAEELIALQKDDAKGAESAVAKREAFEEAHPELMGQAAGATAGTGTMPPPPTPRVAMPRNRIYAGQNIQAPNQSDAQFMGDIPQGARAGAMNTQAVRPVIRPPAPAAPAGRPVKDKKGKTWLYTGTAEDPKTDKDPSHWTAQ